MSIHPSPSRETTLITLCPNVHELILLDMIRVDDGTVAFAKVVSLGISFNYNPVRDSIKTHYRLERFPNLRKVRVVDKRCDNPKPREKAFWHTFGDRGDIIFEDAIGNEVPLILPKVSDEGADSA